MKVLFIVQGEGRGHLTQAITMEELLRRNGHEVVEVLVGKSNSRCLPGFFNRSIQAPVKRFLSPNFLPTPANKRASLARSVAYNLTRSARLSEKHALYTPPHRGEWRRTGHQLLRTAHGAGLSLLPSFRSSNKRRAPVPVPAPRFRVSR